MVIGHQIKTMSKIKINPQAYLIPSDFRALFEKDKLVFSFMLCIEIMRQDGKVSDDEWNFFLRGAAGMDRERPKKPDVDWIQVNAWNNLVDISETIKVFKGIHNDILKTPCWVHIGELEVSSL